MIHHAYTMLTLQAARAAELRAEADRYRVACATARSARGRRARGGPHGPDRPAGGHPPDRLAGGRLPDSATAGPDRAERPHLEARTGSRATASR
jgi:hypothetical protein